MVSVMCEMQCKLFYTSEADVIYLVGFGNSVARVLEASRVSVAWIPVGICQGAMEKTLSYVAGREAFGAALHSNQLVQGKIRLESEFKFEASALTPPVFDFQRN